MSDGVEGLNGKISEQLDQNCSSGQLRADGTAFTL
jgi:hypothetical protein